MQVNKEILFGKYLSGNASADEIKKLSTWLREDPAHQAEFDQAEKIWKSSLHLKKESNADVEEAWNEFKLLRDAQPEIKAPKTNYSWLKIAAAVGLFLVLGIVVSLFLKQPSDVSSPGLAQVVEPTSNPAPAHTPDLNPVAMDTFPAEVQSQIASKVATYKKTQPFTINQAGMVTISSGDSVEIFMLPDNSIVYLNAHSKLEYSPNFNKTNRNVFLSGEAYFDVKKDSSQFVVTCENTIVRGKESLFNIKGYSREKDVEVIVAAGMVEFSGIGYKDFKKLVLKTDETGIYNKEKSAITKLKHQRNNYKWWQKESIKARIKDFFDKLLGRK